MSVHFFVYFFRAIEAPLPGEARLALRPGPEGCLRCGREALTNLLLAKLGSWNLGAGYRGGRPPFPAGRYGFWVNSGYIRNGAPHVLTLTSRGGNRLTTTITSLWRAQVTRGVEAGWCVGGAVRGCSCRQSRAGVH